MGYAYDEMFMLIPGLLGSIPSVIFSIATYVLSSLAVYTVARRRQLRKPWLAWIPVVNVWLLGSLSDQYRYVVDGEIKSKRKVLLILAILKCALTLVIAVMGISALSSAIFGSYRYGPQLWSRVWGPLTTILALCLPLAGVSIAHMVIRFMALYDLYKSMDPNNSVLFLVLSILIRPTEPFFLFFNRNKEKGMPPLRQESVRDPWESENQDYL